MIKGISRRLFGIFGGFKKQPQSEDVSPTKDTQRKPEQWLKTAQVPPQKKFSPRPKKKSVVKQVDARNALEQKKIIELLERLKKRERGLDLRLKSLDEKERFFRGKETKLARLEARLKKEQEEIVALKEEELKKLEQLSGLTKEEVKKQLTEKVDQEIVNWKAKKIEEAKEAIKAQEEELAKEILTDALRHGVVDWVAEYTVSTIRLDDDEVKGRIIGREGRNIRAFERATGVELELDESNDVRLSSFDPVRREIAKLSLQKLIKDGRIQPSRIETVVLQTQKQMDKVLLEEGKKICQAVGVYHLPIDLIKLIGRFKYRFSFGQNLAQHTIEETKIGVALAHELKADAKVVRLGCLLHDIGKVVVEEEGTHIQLGVDLLKRYRIPTKVIDCVAEHHEDKEFSSLESTLVWIADAASGSRPGARYEAHEEYLKRMENIEEIVKSFEGVLRVAAYQAGREVRVIIRPEKVSDDQLKVLVQEMAVKLDEEAKWAGQIKLTAIRETRATITAPIIDKSKKHH